MKDDNISRAAAIDAIDVIPWYHQNKNGEMVLGASDEDMAWYKADEVYMAIESVPSAQPGCEDAVSRADVDILIEEAQTAWLRGDILLMYPALKKGLKKIPPVTPKQPGWIPCKTRKPEKSGLYLVTKQQKTGEIQLATAHYNTAFDEWSGNGNFKKVLAWQPLPLPWKGGQEQNHESTI